jgi:signal transduction histidine kinase
VYRTGTPYEGRSVRLVLVRREGQPAEEIFFDFVCQPLRGDDGEVEAIAVVAFDVTTLASAKEHAEKVNRAKDEFLATLSHELRTPLNTVLGWTTMLLGGTVTEESRQRALEIIHRNAQAQQQLIQDILDVSNIVQGRLRLALQRVRMMDVVRAAAEGVQPALTARRINLTVTGDDRIELTGDPDRLRQVVWNLLSNAAKFTPEGGRVSVAVEQIEGVVRVAVADTGIGIAPEDLARVFQRFWQADTAPGRQSSGLGLGLAIVRHLVELHGGSVTAASAGPLRGTTFLVLLPA